MVAKKISSGKSWIDTLLDGGYDRGKLYLVGGVGVNWLEVFTIRMTVVPIDWTMGDVGNIYIKIRSGSCMIDWGDFITKC